MTPYREVAKNALMEWFQKPEAEAAIRANMGTVEGIDKKIDALGSVTAAVEGVSRELSLTEEEQKEFLDAVVNGPEDSPIFSKVSEKAGDFTPEQELSVLAFIHDKWVVSKSDETTFNEKVEKNKLRQYAPSELIGFNEVKSYLIFLEPVLKSVGVKIDKKDLIDTYHKSVTDYLETMGINNKDDLQETLSSGRLYYPILTAELDSRLSEHIPEMTDQMINNWKEKDNESFEIFKSRSKDNSFNM